MIKLPSSSLSYPRNFVWLMATFPCSNRRLIPQVEFSEIDLLSSWARLERILNNTSPFASNVFMFSFSKITPIPKSFNCLTKFKQSNVFLANLDMDFVMIMSIFLFLQSSIILFNCLRFFVLVTYIYSSVYIPAFSYSGWFLMYIVDYS